MVGAKTIAVARITLQEYWVYRFNFYLGRFRNIIFNLSNLFFWLVIFANRTDLAGYTKSQMIAYVLGVSFINSLVLSTKTADLAGMIKSGELNRFLLLPQSTILYLAGRDLADKLLNLVFTVMEIIGLVTLLRLPFYMPQAPATYLVFGLAIGLAIVLYLLFSLFISILAFWTEEVWGTRWLLNNILLQFMAGLWFPIDVLPELLKRISTFTPFPYLIFFPIKIYNEQLTSIETSRVLLIMVAWIGLFYFSNHLLWFKGIKKYGAYGN